MEHKPRQRTREYVGGITLVPTFHPSSILFPVSERINLNGWTGGTGLGWGAMANRSAWWLNSFTSYHGPWAGSEGEKGSELANEQRWGEVWGIFRAAEGPNQASGIHERGHQLVFVLLPPLPRPPFPLLLSSCHCLRKVDCPIMGIKASFFSGFSPGPPSSFLITHSSWLLSQKWLDSHPSSD